MGTSWTTLNKSAESGHFCLVPNFEQKFQPFTVQYDVSCGLCYTWASLRAQLVKNAAVVQETLVWFFWVGRIHWRKDRLAPPVFLGFPGGSASKESTRNVRDLGSIPGLGRSPGERKGYPLQYSGLENSMDSPWGSQTVGHNWVTFTFVIYGLLGG